MLGRSLDKGSEPGEHRKAAEGGADHRAARRLGGTLLLLLRAAQQPRHQRHVARPRTGLSHAQHDLGEAARHVVLQCNLCGGRIGGRRVGGLKSQKHCVVSFVDYQVQRIVFPVADQDVGCLIGTDAVLPTFQI